MVEIQQHPPQGSKLKKIVSLPDSNQLEKYSRQMQIFFSPVCIMYMTQLIVWCDQDFTN